MRRLGMALAVIFTVLAAGAIAVVLLAGPLLGGAIERIGSQATDTPMRVGGVDVAWSDWTATLRDVTIGNPPGFEQRPAMALGAITIAIEPRSFGESPIVLRELQVADPVADVEIRDDGETNLAALRRNLQRSAEAGEPGPPPAEPGDVAAQKASRTRLRVEELVVSEGRARVRVPEVKEGDEPVVTIPLGATTLDDVGGARGETPREMARTVALALVESTARAVADAAVHETVGSGGLGGVVEEAIDAGRELLGQDGEAQ